MSSKFVSRDEVYIHAKRIILSMAERRRLMTGIRELPANLDRLAQDISKALIDAPTCYDVDCPDPDCT